MPGYGVLRAATMFKGNPLIVVLVAAVLVVTLFPAGLHARQGGLIKAGDPFPQLAMPVPVDEKDRAYLDLPAGDTFTLKDIKAQVVLVEILSVFCTSCQHQAPHYNRLYQLIENHPLAKGRIKIVGFAAGNGQVAIEDFKKRHQVRFPLVPDPDFEMHEAIGGSRTPFSIYVRQDPAGGPGVVAGTHLGLNQDYQKLFQELKAIMLLDLESLKKKGRGAVPSMVQVRPILGENELTARLKVLLERDGSKVLGLHKVVLKSRRKVYSALVRCGGRTERLFAEVVSRAAPCDVCHDAHFIYIFDSSGRIRDFEPLQLTKYENQPWNQEDLAKMRRRLLGTYLADPYSFDPRVDAVSSATITSAVIFHSLSRGRALLQELKEKGLR